ncbi:3-oxoacyl-ACP reductase FabG [Roseburia hominis]
MHFHKKTVLVTGASRGIGKACALLFAEKGYHVFLNCRTSRKEVEAVKAKIENNIPYGSCEIVMGDIGNPNDVRKIFGTIHLTCQGLDVLINNAGIAYMGLLSDMTDEEWNRMLQTNLSSVFYCCREAIPHMVSVKRGRIINISSMWGTVGASCEAAYSAAKSGIHGLTRALAKELAPSNIQVNAVACGVIDTTMNDLLDAEEKAALADEIPAGRFGTPEEVAHLVWDMANAPAYVTGQIVGIDGGYI